MTLYVLAFVLTHCNASSKSAKYPEPSSLKTLRIIKLASGAICEAILVMWEP